MNEMDEELLKQIYDDMLDDCYPMITIGTLEYYPSVAFYRIDPVAYRVGMNDYESVLREANEEDGSYAFLFGDEEE